MPKQRTRNPKPAFPALPDRLLVVPWDPTDTRLGPVTVNESTAEAL